jgi:hypothetical protein
MCLSKLAEFPVELDTAGVGTGYKVGSIGKDGKLRNFWESGPARKWNKAKKDKIKVHRRYDPEYFEYDSGFHVFIDQQDAFNALTYEENKNFLYTWVIVKVKFRGIICQGYDPYAGHQTKCVVAEEIWWEPMEEE